MYSSCVTNKANELQVHMLQSKCSTVRLVISHVVCCLLPYYLTVMPPPPPPPPYFRAKLLYRVILPPLHAPPAGRSSRFVILQFLHVCMRVQSVEELSCIKRAENSLRTGLGLFSLILDGFLRPVILHIILLCSLAASRRTTCYVLITVRGQQLFSTATACRSKEFSSSTTQQSFVDLSTRIHGRGGA